MTLLEALSLALDKRTLSQSVQNHVIPPSSSPFPVEQLSAISGQQSEIRLICWMLTAED
jgi:hypothetical protein